MSAVDVVDNALSVDATLIAGDLGIDPDEVIEATRTGRLTAVCERGIEQDAGRLRVTFYHADRRLCLVIDDHSGRVLERSATRLRRRWHRTRLKERP